MTDKLFTTIGLALATLENHPEILRRENPDSVLDFDSLRALNQSIANGGQPRLQCVISGGVLQSVASDHPLSRMFAVERCDFDTGGCDLEDLPRVLDRHTGAVEPCDFSDFMLRESARYEIVEEGQAVA